MKKVKKVHYLGGDYGISFCGKTVSATTVYLEHITCEECKHAMVTILTQPVKTEEELMWEDFRAVTCRDDLPTRDVLRVQYEAVVKHVREWDGRAKE